MARTNLKRLDEGKLYYSISEVCSMTGLEQHVLRYWESEFPQLRPKKNRSGNRAYRAKEIKIIRYIKYLLYEEMYTIPGAKKKMADANVADLEGQLTLIRVPATAPPVQHTLPQAEHLLKKEDGTAAFAVKPAVTALASHSGHGNGHVTSEEKEEVRKLRQELETVKRELNSLLDILQSAKAGGRFFP